MKTASKLMVPKRCFQKKMTLIQFIKLKKTPVFKYIPSLIFPHLLGYCVPNDGPRISVEETI